MHAHHDFVLDSINEWNSFVVSEATVTWFLDSGGLDLVASAVMASPRKRDTKLQEKP